MTKVIDISHHNGSIDFNSVANECDKVIIRCGYGDNIPIQDDKKFPTYIKGALENNLSIALYIYSYAETDKQAKSEAQHIVRLAKPYKGVISDILWYDIEEQKSMKKALNLFNTFKEEVEKMGWKAGLYTGEYYFNGTNLSNISKNTPLWIAKYGSNNGDVQHPPQLDNGHKVSMWQYTSNGRVQGIKGAVDLSMCLENNLFKSEKSELTIETAIDVLSDNGVISTPEYWYNAVKIVKYLEPLLINMANELRE